MCEFPISSGLPAKYFENSAYAIWVILLRGKILVTYPYDSHAVVACARRYNCTSFCLSGTKHQTACFFNQSTRQRIYVLKPSGPSYGGEYSGRRRMADITENGTKWHHWFLLFNGVNLNDLIDWLWVIISKVTSLDNFTVLNYI